MNAKQLNKGEYGEKLVIETYNTMGYEHQGPWLWWGEDALMLAPEDRAHTFDHIFKRDGRFIFGDSKAKAKYNVYQDTGINLCHFDRYWNLYLTMRVNPCFDDFLLFFVDESPSEQRIYYVSLAELHGVGLLEWRKQKKTRTDVDSGGKPLIMFSSSLWHGLRQLAEDEVATLRGLCRRNYDYPAAR